jgi:hypothetical protein
MGANALAYCCPSVVNEEKKVILLTRERKGWTEIKAKENKRGSENLSKKT